MGTLKGDFIGFTFNNVHSSSLNLIRVSNGNRYEENLLPEFTDLIVTPAGRDGGYYFGSSYKTRNFNLEIAFDNISELNYRDIVALFSDKKIHDLIFDERPYKIYRAKITNSPTFKTICFDTTEGRRYRGEGSLSFICMSPFARNRFKYLNQYTLTSIPEWKRDNNDSIGIYENLDEWSAASKLKSIQGTYDTFTNLTQLDKGFNLFNAGDIETDFYLTISGLITDISVSLGTNQLNCAGLILESGDTSYRINTKTNLIEGLNSSNKITGNIYNRYIVSGSFFKIPVGDSTIVVSAAGEGLTLSSETVQIEYNYLYF